MADRAMADETADADRRGEMMSAHGERLRNDPDYQAKVERLRSERAAGKFGRLMGREELEEFRRRVTGS